MVSHDIEFCAEYANRCAMFFDGNVVADEAPRVFFAGNSFYTTAANRMARHLIPEAVTADDIISACGGILPEEAEMLPEEEYYMPSAKTAPEENVSEKLPIWRRLLAYIMGAVVFMSALVSLTEPDIPWLVGNNKTGLYIILIIASLLLAVLVNRKDGRLIENEQVHKDKRKLSKRTLAAAFMILLAVPLTIYTGVFYLGDR
jgi:energy-coupling factor transport system ATP-binding protein